MISQPPMATQDSTPLDNVKEMEKRNLFEYASAKSHFNSIITDWSMELERTLARRRIRYVELNTEELRKSGMIENDETFIPMRVIDENIRREQPAFVSFLTQANRLISLVDQITPASNTEMLETELTKGLKYHGWEEAWTEMIDGTQLHGWDAMEVVYDSTKPLNVGLEHVGHADLYFPIDTINNIQNAPFILRKYGLTRTQLNDYVRDYGFNADSVARITESKTNDTKTTVFDIYKVFFKWEGIVYVAWFSLRYDHEWLKPPVQFYNGVRKKVTVPPSVEEQQIALLSGGGLQPKTEWQEISETLYPIFIHKYLVTEDKKIYNIKGRAFLDANKQEATTSIVTGFVNGLTRATDVYAAPSQPSGSGAAPVQTKAKLQHGALFSEPLTFFSMPYPNADFILSSLQYFDSRNLSETGQATESLRRKRGEKTAKEWNVAQEDSAFLNSVPMALFSKTVRDVYTYAWRIIQSQALQGKIALLCQQIIADGVYQNDDAKINRNYDIRAAGDVEVIQKANKVEKMMQMWPVISATPLAQTFLMDIIRTVFPESAAKYEQIMQQGDQGKQLVQALTTVLTTILKAHPEEVTALAPQEQQQLAQLQQQVQMYLNPQKP